MSCVRPGPMNTQAGMQLAFSGLRVCSAAAALLNPPAAKALKHRPCWERMRGLGRDGPVVGVLHV